MPYKVFLKKNEERRLLAGHAWVYANEVARIEGKDKNGSLAAVYANDGRFIGRGYINHLSKILVRIFLRSEAEEEDAALEKRIRAAFALRETLFGAETDCYRCVFAEADDLPALIVDRYGDYLVAEFLSLGMDQRREKIADILEKVCAPKGICLRGDAPVRRKEGLPLENRALRGEIPERILVRENGLVMEVDVLHGQKTGYFLDQKENRFAVRKYCKGAEEVLDCFCNSGGFSLNAATVAKKVISLDISPLALRNVEDNAKLNGIENITTLCGDVFDELRKFKAAKRQFDTVILDPPAFCKTADEVKDAYRGYKDINLTAMKIVKSGGFLITCSCSHYMTMPLFEKMLIEAARESGRTVRSVEVKTQAPDHPSLLCAEETQYLKFFVLQVI